MAMTRPFTFRAIAWPFARLAIARYYVYGLLYIIVIMVITKFSCINV